MIKTNTLLKKSSAANNDLTILLLYGISVFIIFMGVWGIIEYKSPVNLSTFPSLLEAFFANIQYHLLIIFGALIFTLSTWLASNNH